MIYESSIWSVVSGCPPEQSRPHSNKMQLRMSRSSGLIPPPKFWPWPLPRTWKAGPSELSPTKQQIARATPSRSRPSSTQHSCSSLCVSEIGSSVVEEIVLRSGHRVCAFMHTSIIYASGIAGFLPGSIRSSKWCTIISMTTKDTAEEQSQSRIYESLIHQLSEEKYKAVTIL
jgi:hypothetical protein